MRIIIYIGLLSYSGYAVAQGERNNIRSGNKLFKEKKFEDATVSYRKAIESNPSSVEGTFNLGAAEYRQDNFDDAQSKFESIANKDSETGYATKAKAYHNLGNTLLQKKKYQESIDAYKNALRLNPKDMDTKYNLAYAQKFLQREQQQQKQDDKKNDQKNKDDKKKDDQKQQQEKEKQQQEKEEKEKQQQPQEKEKQEKQEQQKQEQQKQEQQENPQQLSKEDAARLLEALKNDEQKVQDKIKKQKVKVKNVKVEKDW